MARRRPRPPQQNGKSIMPWSLQYGAMLHLQVMQEKKQQWTNDKLTHLSFFVYYKKNFFVSFCSFFSQKNTLIIIMIINIFIFNHRFTDCFLSFFFCHFLGADVPSSSVVWDEIKKQKERGGYPWTHLSHDQDAEVWIDPVKLPRDITT